uniref:Zinc finger protein Xfin n=1 Tax=Culex pipiens TaxID=7175 RepID=A0A8D8MKK5_CULPI
MSVYIKEEPSLDIDLPLVSIPMPEPDDVGNFAPHPEPVPFCALCIRECPQSSEFFEFNCDNSADFRDMLRDIVEIEFREQSFNVCRACWKIVKMICDFRKCCLKAQRWLERTDEAGLAAGDDWISEGIVQTIDHLQTLIVDQTQRIEKTEPAENELVTVMSVDHIKIQPYEAEETEPKEQLLAEDFDCREEMCKQVAQADDLLVEKPSKDWRSKKCEEKKFFCELCDIGFARIGHLRLHQSRIIHKQRVKLQAKLKSASSKSKSGCNNDKTELIIPDDDLLVVQSVEKVEPNKEDKNPLKCEECDFTFQSGKHLRIHKLSLKHQLAVKIYNKETSVVIKDIKRRMEDLERSKAKRKQQSKPPLNRKHKCRKCGAKLASQQSLQAHMRFVHTDERFVCDICDGKFKKKSALKRHIFVQHVVTRDFVCPVCGNRYWEETKLMGHMTSHKGYRPYECGQCDKGYHSKNQLIAHIKKFHKQRNRADSDSDPDFVC